MMNRASEPSTTFASCSAPQKCSGVVVPNLLAGDPAFLERYESGDARFHDLIDALPQTASDNPPQVALLTEAEATIDAWIPEIVEPMIELRASIAGASTMDDMADLVGDGRRIITSSAPCGRWTRVPRRIIRC